MKFSIFAQDSQQSSISMLIGLAIILGFMYWARVIVIPVALSILITFLLIPAVNRILCNYTTNQYISRHLSRI